MRSPQPGKTPSQEAWFANHLPWLFEMRTDTPSSVFSSPSYMRRTPCRNSRARAPTERQPSAGIASFHTGVDRLTARADGLASVEFVADVRAGPAAQFVSDIDLDQVGSAEETLPVQPSVRVADQYGNAVSGINVTFTVAGAAASIIEHPTAVTDSTGHAIAGAWTLGSATGDYTLTAAAADVPAARVVFRARINAPFAVSSLAAGGMSSCAIASGGTYCWGASFQGNSHVLTPELLSSAPPLVTLVVGVGHACGLTSSGTAYCWGANAYGQLGLGTVTDIEPQPRAVTGGLAFTALVVGGEFTCGLTTDRRIYCWGDNSVGQLGSEGRRHVHRRRPSGRASHRRDGRRLPTRMRDRDIRDDVLLGRGRRGSAGRTCGRDLRDQWR